MTKREEIVSVAESKVGLNRNEVGCGGDGAWCAMFVSGVLVIVGIGEGVTSDSCTLMQRYMSESDKWSEPDDWPIPGDIIFFDWDNKKEERPLDHVGICVGFNNDTLQITYVNGNGDSSYYVTEEEINVNAKGKDGHNLVAYWMRYVGDEETEKPEYEDKEVELKVRQLHKGMTGGDVKALQRLLFADGYSVGMSGDDGDFGSDTEKAVKKYQKDHGLDPDGIAGEKTLAALWNCEPLSRKSKKENK
jgi:hypothetical protein